MLALLVGAAATAALLLAGTVAAVTANLHPGTRTTASTSAAESLGGGAAVTGPADAGGDDAVTGAAGTGAAQAALARDALAAAPMPAVGYEAAHPAPVSLRDPGAPIVLPPSTATGLAGVPSGFPETPAGAMAQLAAIDAAVMQAGSLAAARPVAADWIAPGGPTVTGWSTLQALGDLFTSAGLSGGGSPRLGVTLTPLMGQVKGTVGAGFVVPCVDFEMDVTLASSDRGAVADCQRMMWTGGRWMIGAGTEPAAAPSVWPDTDTAISVGYVDVRRG